nr:unnamed protein product [Callosobruchus analis]
MDGKHIAFQGAKSAGSTYYYYKGEHSMVLLAMVDATYKLIYIDIGVNGRVSDGGVYARSSLAIHLTSQSRPIPHVILADAAFPFSNHIMTPYPFRNMSHEERIFNYRLSRGRRIVENVFGIMANRFRIFITEDPSFIQEDIANNYVFKYGLSSLV